MERRSFLKAACSSLAFSAFSGASFAASDASKQAAKDAISSNKRPNVIIFLADDAGYGDFGFQGSKVQQTPHIDSIAKTGTRFSQAYVTASVCCPSRAGLLTGRYQQRFGHEFNGPDAKPMPGYTQDDLGLDPNEKTFADYFKSLGYRTCVIGKWNMGLRPQFQPWNRNFDEFFGFLGGARSYFPIEGEVNEHHVMIKNQKVYPEEKITYTTDDFTDYAVDYVQRHKDRPFFLYLSYNAVHTPMHAKEEDLEQFSDVEPWRRRANAAMTKAMDDSIGRVSAKLKELGLEDDTLIMFFNDNGGTNNGASNGKLRGMKGSQWEGGIRVPCIMKWPGEIKENTVYDNPVSGFDFLPTAYAAAGGSKILGKPFDGVNLLPYLKGKKKSRPHKTLFWKRGRGYAVREGDWKWVHQEDGTTGLYNLAEDVSEKNDLSEKYPEKLKHLKKLYKQWESEMAPPKWKRGGGWIEYDIAEQLNS
ncbi:sulfatase-like hydrolase/transferase [Sedimentisphaera salicampi]|uniref:Arylsulfatase n=1 Tax=Sedimentisphaera salicampi TaxID=1941349 RepID=A0A1W6LQG8_9BACT|nr:sulfatase-like hydrolase/transferase [Sedimentisphaera salicampi]ARN58001.1 Arylsulfatase [Sedimentisphaera salicampi]OXU14166.1 Arylsulfatase [Sedimentisphaera salicampi]